MRRALTFLKENIWLSLFVFLTVGVGVGYLLSGQTINKECQISIENTYQEPVTEYVVVDVSGAVQKPGLYKVPVSHRVGEVVAEAEGFSQNASVEWISKNLNMAKKLEDSQKIYIPFEWDTYVDTQVDVSQLEITNTPSATSSNKDDNVPTSGLLNVNIATQEELDELPGIGPVYAQKIIENRSYENFDDFLTKSGLTTSTAEKIKNLITF